MMEHAPGCVCCDDAPAPTAGPTRDGRAPAGPTRTRRVVMKAAAPGADKAVNKPAVDAQAGTAATSKLGVPPSPTGTPLAQKFPGAGVDITIPGSSVPINTATRTATPSVQTAGFTPQVTTNAGVRADAISVTPVQTPRADLSRPPEPTVQREQPYRENPSTQVRVQPPEAARATAYTQGYATPTTTWASTGTSASPREETPRQAYSPASPTAEAPLSPTMTTRREGSTPAAAAAVAPSPQQSMPSSTHVETRPEPRPATTSYQAPAPRLEPKATVNSWTEPGNTSASITSPTPRSLAPTQEPQQERQFRVENTPIRGQETASREVASNRDQRVEQKQAPETAGRFERTLSAVVWISADAATPSAAENLAKAPSSAVPEAKVATRADIAAHLKQTTEQPVSARYEATARVERKAPEVSNRTTVSQQRIPQPKNPLEAYATTYNRSQKAQKSNNLAGQPKATQPASSIHAASTTTANPVLKSASAMQSLLKKIGLAEGATRDELLRIWMSMQQGSLIQKKKKKKQQKGFRHGEQIGSDHTEGDYTEHSEELELLEESQETTPDTEDSFDPWQADLEAELAEIRARTNPQTVVVE